VRATKPCLTRREVRLAYLPGATFPALEIAQDPAAAFRYTSRGNLVGVVTNGTAVPGLGPVGPLAAKPMQEGVAVLFKRLADIDVFDLEVDATDPDRFVETVLRLEPTFGGINLKDIRVPEGRDLRPPARADGHSRLPREFRQHGRGGRRGPAQRAGARVEAHRHRAGRALRGRHRRHGLCPALPGPGRA
jgi:hypothetical protein